MRTLLLLCCALIAGCGSSDNPNEVYGAKTATGGLEQLGRGDLSCTCQWDGGVVQLGCQDSDEVAPELQLTTFSFRTSTYRNVRHISSVSWTSSIVGTDADTNLDVGLVTSEVGLTIEDRRDGVSGRWVPLHIHQMQTNAVNSCINDCAAKEGGVLLDGHFWCSDNVPVVEEER